MVRFLVITDPDTALGFRLAGVEVSEATSDEDAADRLLALLTAKKPGIVIYNEQYQAALTENIRVALEESVSPVFFAIPVVQDKRVEESREQYLARLLRRAIGYQLKIKR